VYPEKLKFLNKVTKMMKRTDLSKKAKEKKRQAMPININDELIFSIYYFFNFYRVL